MPNLLKTGLKNQQSQANMESHISKIKFLKNLADFMGAFAPFFLSTSTSFLIFPTMLQCEKTWFSHDLVLYHGGENEKTYWCTQKKWSKRAHKICKVLQEINFWNVVLYVGLRFLVFQPFFNILLCFSVRFTKKIPI